MSVISPVPVLVSCTNLSPEIWSPEHVSSSNIICSVVSPVIPPFTIVTTPVAPAPFVLVLLKLKVSPITYPEPPASTTVSVTLPEPTLLI